MPSIKSAQKSKKSNVKSKAVPKKQFHTITAYALFIIISLISILIIFLFQSGVLQLSNFRIEQPKTNKVMSTSILENVDKHDSFNEKVNINDAEIIDVNNENQIFPFSLESLTPTFSKYAYVTLLSGIDSTFKYRGFLYNVLIMRKSLVDLTSKADFIVLLGFNEKNITKFQSDLILLQRAGILLYYLPRLVDESQSLSFAEMALLKVSPWSFTKYSKIQFLDGDVMPTKNLDCFFDVSYQTFTIGAVSPLNSGWYLAKPNLATYKELIKKAIWRLGIDWDQLKGWGDEIPSRSLSYRGGKKYCEKWDFNGADMDQGLLCHHYIINHGNAMLIDTDMKKVSIFDKGIKNEPAIIIDINEGLKSCNGQVPTDYFIHFTGRSKPWLRDKKSDKKIPGGPAFIWEERLLALNLNVTIETIQSQELGSPLGYWNSNFPKGGLRTKVNKN